MVLGQGGGLNRSGGEDGRTSQEPRTMFFMLSPSSALPLRTESVISDFRSDIAADSAALELPPSPAAAVEHHQSSIMPVDPRCLLFTVFLRVPLGRRHERAGAHAMPPPAAPKEIALVGAHSPRIESLRFRISWWHVCPLGGNSSATARRQEIISRAPPPS